jgi:thioredoxin 1
MNQPPPVQPKVSPPWLLVGGLLLGGSLLAYMVYASLEPASNVVKLTDDNWRTEVTESKIPVLVDFWGPNCTFCDSQAQIIAKLAERYNGKVKVGKLNIAENPNLANKHEIRSIPTVIIFNGSDTPAAPFEPGLSSEKELIKTIEFVLAKNR